ncbi:MAG: hypothetical protein KBT29_09600, partial [Prevotellaceae bacterium]|nr:hypothetical protein [Candidatus Minthosoma caballi]
DGSLCKLWTNIDMVPGETYHITTHNGYYIPDSDYERRVGLYSGKSMFIGRENDDVEMTGGYNDDVVVEDTVLVVEDEKWEPAERVDNPKLTSAQQMELERKAVALDNTLELINGLKEGLEERIRLAVQKNSYLLSLDNYFDELIKMNTKYDKQAMDLFNTASSNGVPQEKIAEGYKDLLNELSDQNKIFNELYKHFGFLSKKATKCQKHINKLMEKYMNGISTALAKE